MLMLDAERPKLLDQSRPRGHQQQVTGTQHLRELSPHGHVNYLRRQGALFQKLAQNFYTCSLFVLV